MEESLGTKYVETDRFEFDQLYEDSGPSTPMFFILSPGVYPLQEVEKLGTTLVLRCLHILYYLLWFKTQNTICMQVLSWGFPLTKGLYTTCLWDRVKRK